jgi:hypothetical protein
MGKIKHAIVNFKNGKYSMERIERVFATMEDLMNYFRLHPVVQYDIFSLFFSVSHLPLLLLFTFSRFCFEVMGMGKFQTTVKIKSNCHQLPKRKFRALLTCCR